MSARAVILAALAAAGLVALHQARAAVPDIEPAPGAGQGEADPFAQSLPELGQLGDLAMRGLDNLGAFLAMIAQAEGTERYSDPYRVLMGGQVWTGSLATHPARQGWAGTKLPDHQCRAAGFSPGCVSTAAGRYQIIRPTFDRLTTRCPFPGFTPEAQDWMAGELLRESGAINDVQEGRFAQAVNKVRRVWASMPGAGYLQPEKALAELQAVYIRAGGSIA